MAPDLSADERRARAERRVTGLLPPELRSDSWAPEAGHPYETILVAHDGSPDADNALTWAMALMKAIEAPEWGLHIVTVVAPMPTLFDEPDDDHPYPATYDAMMAAENENAEEILDRALAKAAEAGLRATKHHVHGSPVRSIAEVAEKIEADLVVVGSHGQGVVERTVLGSVSDGVKDRAPCSVLIAKGTPVEGPVVVATAGRAVSHHIITDGCRLARALERQAVVAHIVEPRGLDDEIHGTSYYQQLQEQYAALDAAAREVVTPSWLLLELGFGPATDRLLEIATAKDAALLTVGTRGLGIISRMFLGSVSRKVAHRASMSVLIVKPQGAEE